MDGIIHDLVRYNERVTMDFSARLRAGLSVTQGRLIESVASEASLRGLPLFAVGGLPRDLWLGLRPTDLDLVVEGDAMGLARALASKHGGKVTAHSKFGTAKWDLRGTRFEARSEASSPNQTAHAGHFLDLISARSETYRHPAALPTVKPGTIADDVGRRDFTINTLAVRLDAPHYGEVRDDFGAIKDLSSRAIRVLHPNSFADDPTRMYRAVRYEQRFGFTISEDTLALIPEARSLVGKLSGARIRHELDLILDEAAGASILRRLADLGLLESVHPALPHGTAALARLRSAGQTPPIPMPSWSRRHVAWLLWLEELTEAQLKSLGRRLHLSSAALRDLLAAARLYTTVSSLARWRPSKSAAFLDDYPELAVYSVSLATAGEPRRVLDEYLTKWKHMRPTTTGHDLKRLGLQPGPAYRTILQDLRAAWIDGQVSDADGEQRRLNELLLRQANHHARGTSRKAERRKATKPARREH